MTKTNRSSIASLPGRLRPIRSASADRGRQVARGPVPLARVGIGVTAALLAAVSGLAWFLEDRVGVPNASSVFLIAVVAVAGRFGTRLAIAAAVGAFLIYDAFFVEPRFTLTVSDPGEWLNLVLLLVMGIVVGQLAAAQRDRADAAIAREREAVVLFRVGRALATRPSTAAVLPELAEILRAETRMDRVRISLATPSGLERTAVDTSVAPRTATTWPVASPEVGIADGAEGAGEREAEPDPTWRPPATHTVLRRTPGEAPAVWVRVHRPSSAGPAGRRSWPGRTAAIEGAVAGRGDAATYRVVIEAGGRQLGSIWSVRSRSTGDPDQTETQLLSAAADQIGQALDQDRLGREASEKEIARRSDALKTALLDSVSHDLRTPLASIRAAAGTLLDRDVALGPGAQEATAEAIDREADHLNRLVTNLLDLSRIEAGELRPRTEPFELAELVQETISRLRPRLSDRRIEVVVPVDLPPVLVDEVLIDEVLTNLIDNAVKYTEPGARIRVSAVLDAGRPEDGPDRPPIRLTVEDDGPGVPDELLDRLSERFFRVRRAGERSRPGSGIGLTVVRGLVEAMGGGFTASRGALGGLAITATLPSAARPISDGSEP